MAHLSSREIEALHSALSAALRELPANAIPGWNDPSAVGRSGEAEAIAGLTDILIRYTAELFRFNEKLGLVEATPTEFVRAHLDGWLQ